jgi:glycosyltransferase involved in cell wall biosynthesis
MLTSSESPPCRIGVVVIGRNEGDRLRRCLKSALGRAEHIVYVDSGSTDDSVPFARSLGVETVSLDLSVPFTAARARNAGLTRLLETCPSVDFVQFVDGDCELVDGWLDRAAQELHNQPNVAVVCGRRRERQPAILYNLLCDMEWNTPVGEATACGGDALMRVASLQHVGGFRDDLIAGEEPELCVRLRETGWKILRIDREMTLHDAAMTRFTQWWRRTARSGYGFANVSWLHRRGPIRLWTRETRSVWFWAFFLPLAAILPAFWSHGLTLLLLMGYPLLGLRVYLGRRRRGDTRADAVRYALFCVVGKFPQWIGQIRFHRNRALGRAGSLIEYK